MEFSFFTILVLLNKILMIIVVVRKKHKNETESCQAHSDIILRVNKRDTILDTMFVFLYWTC